MEHHIIKVANDALNGQRALYIDDQLSHQLDETKLQALLKSAQLQAWTSNPSEGQQLGTELYALFNGSGQKLKELTQSRDNRGQPLFLYFDLPFALDALPIELLHDQHFLSLRSDTCIIRRITDRNRLADKQPEQRALCLLFMACSPLDLADRTLQFEKEEEAIFRDVAKFPIDITPEDSGSIQGLQETLIQNNGFDVVHLTGHAGHDAELGPVFYMENEIGNLHKVTPRDLARALRDYPPRLLFLSGCSTGKSDNVNEAASFAHQLMAEEEGPAMVLGWACQWRTSPRHSSLRNSTNTWHKEWRLV